MNKSTDLLIAKDFAKHLDNYRSENNISEMELCEGICSTRQYRRYVSGEYQIPLKNLSLFLNKLEVTHTEFYYTYAQRQDEEFRKVFKIYEMIKANDLNLALEKCRKLEKQSFMNINNKKLLEFCVHRANYLNNHLHKYQVLENMGAIINYPDCLKDSSYDFVDILILNFIAEIEVEFNREFALNRLIDILNNDDLIKLTTISQKYFPAVYANVALYLTKLHKYEDALLIAKKGIEYSLFYHDLSATPKLRYLKALSLLQLGYIRDAEIEAIRCLQTLIALEDKDSTIKYYEVIKGDFGIDPLTWINKYKDDLLK